MVDAKYFLKQYKNEDKNMCLNKEDAFLQEYVSAK